MLQLRNYRTATLPLRHKMQYLCVRVNFESYNSKFKLLPHLIHRFFMSKPSLGGGTVFQFATTFKLYP